MQESEWDEVRRAISRAMFTHLEEAMARGEAWTFRNVDAACYVSSGGISSRVAAQPV